LAAGPAGEFKLSSRHLSRVRGTGGKGEKGEGEKKDGRKGRKKRESKGEGSCAPIEVYESRRLLQYSGFRTLQHDLSKVCEIT